MKGKFAKISQTRIWKICRKII